MATAMAPRVDLDDSFARDLTGMYEAWRAATAPAPGLALLNEDLASEVGLDAAELRSEAGVALLVGNASPEGSTPIAQAYAGHQFGGYSPRLGDGRALLVGELVDEQGRRRDLHLKGSGRTPFARGGDGKAALGPMLREYVIGEAMHALRIPTTRALAVTTTGERIRRDDGMLPGAVLTRIASSHLRVGSFQYAAASGDSTLLRRLANYAIDRHHPAARDAANPYLGLFDAVLHVQAELVARWMLVGFIHGVMNTDNMTISGETIDYGPCAFMDAFDPTTVFSSIDHGGRYAYGNQPAIAQWNLARLAEALLPLIDEDTDTAVAAATEVLRSFPDRYKTAWVTGMRTKLGVVGEAPGDDNLMADFLGLLHTQSVDLTLAFRGLSGVVRGDAASARARFADPTSFDAWTQRWLARLDLSPRDSSARADAMDEVNPVYVPRNHLVEQALAAATVGDLVPLERLLDVLVRPFEQRPGLERYAEPAPAGGACYKTFCGT
ncbi:MAG TPA: YdiU family protein [Acidimicrobiales bacterium]|nr:YdiU family protein [Acidimicrobiales bacterium]